MELCLQVPLRSSTGVTPKKATPLQRFKVCMAIDSLQHV